MRAAHERPQRGRVEIAFAGMFARRGAHGAPSIEAFAEIGNDIASKKKRSAAAEQLVFGHGALHLLAGGVGGGADALYAQLEVVGIGCAAERFLEADEFARIEVV